MGDDQLAARFEEELRRLGFTPVLLSASKPASAFGDCEVIVRLDPILLRLVRDRGQEFLHVAPALVPGRFHQFDDLEIAWGWRSVEQVLGKREPEPISAVLGRLRANIDEIKAAFELDRAPATMKRIEEAMRKRGEAFAARLR
jgi:hypothetical protein